MFTYCVLLERNMGKECKKVNGTCPPWMIQRSNMDSDIVSVYWRFLSGEQEIGACCRYCLCNRCGLWFGWWSLAGAGGFSDPFAVVLLMLAGRCHLLSLLRKHNVDVFLVLFRRENRRLGFKKTWKKNQYSYAPFWSPAFVNKLAAHTPFMERSAVFIRLSLVDEVGGLVGGLHGAGWDEAECCLDRAFKSVCSMDTG